MAEFLTFSLWAPMAAMGDIAVGERRVGGNRPARSAILGLIAAALGVERLEEARLAAIEAGYGLALLVERPGELLQDYHSTQLPRPGRNRKKPTRRDELADPRRLNTILSWRDYRTDPWITAALWARAEAPHALDEIARYLRAPRFTLYFGRKACPLGAPTHPVLLEASTIAEAFQRRSTLRPEPEQRLRRRLRLDGGGLLYSDTDAITDHAGPPLGTERLRIERRRDVALNRRRWQFGLRDEWVGRLAPEAS